MLLSRLTEITVFEKASTKHVYEFFIYKGDLLIGEQRQLVGSARPLVVGRLSEEEAGFWYAVPVDRNGRAIPGFEVQRCYPDQVNCLPLFGTLSPVKAHYILRELLKGI